MKQNNMTIRKLLGQTPGCLKTFIKGDNITIFSSISKCAKMEKELKKHKVSPLDILSENNRLSWYNTRYGIYELQDGLYFYLKSKEIQADGLVTYRLHRLMDKYLK